MSIRDNCIWDKAARELEEVGIATIFVEEENNFEKCFQEFREILDRDCDDGKGKGMEDAANATGYHGVGGLSPRYNAYREGIVCSNGETDSDVMTEKMQGMLDSMYNSIANHVLKSIAKRLKLSSEDWFQETYGPMHTSSQWHMKRYVEPNHPSLTAVHHKDTNEDQNSDEVIEWLPAHTDPSLISVVIQDAPGIQRGHAMGLQYQTVLDMKKDQEPKCDNDTATKKGKVKVWKEVNAHGHGVATVFVGSVLSYITGGQYHAAKHRVIYRSQYSNRVAATLFVRPQPTSLLQVPPTISFQSVRIRRNCQFKDWLARVSRNYSKAKNNQKHDNNKQINNNISPQNKSNQNNQTQHESKTSSNEQLNDQHKKDIVINPTHWEDEFTELTLVPAVKGQEKYLGGEQSSFNHHIYTVPGHASRVLEMDITKNPVVVKPIGPAFPGQFKWLRGVSLDNGVMYAIPCHSHGMLKIDSRTNTVSLISWKEDQEGAPSCPHDLKWKYHGAVLSPHNGCIYCIPQAAEYVMKLDPKIDQVTFVGPALPGKNKWYGGVLGTDGAIYGICQNATGILRIDPKNDDNVTIHGNFPLGHFKWHGAVNDYNNSGNIYAIPNHTDRVLKITPGSPNPQLSLIGPSIPTGQHRTDGKYRFLGGAVAGDGYVYLFPSDADYVLQINTQTDEVRTYGQFSLFLLSRIRILLNITQTPSCLFDWVKIITFIM